MIGGTAKPPMLTRFRAAIEKSLVLEPMAIGSALLAVLNSHFYHQRLNKINKCAHQNLELGIFTHTFHKFWYKHVLQVTNIKCIEKFTERCFLTLNCTKE